MAARLQIIKAQASSVDAIIVESAVVAKALTTATMRVFASSVCDYSGPVGASGLFVVDSSSMPPVVEFYAPEGLRATPPAAGLRCAARYLGERLDTSNVEFAAGENEPVTARIDVSKSPLVQATVASPSISITRPGLAFDWIDADLWTVTRGSQEHAVGLLQHNESFDIERLVGSVARLQDHTQDGVTVALPLDRWGLNWAAATWSLDGSQKIASVEGAECVAVAAMASTKAESGDVLVRMAGGPIALVARQDVNGAMKVDTTGNATFIFTAEVDVDEIVYSPAVVYGIDARIEEMLAFNKIWESNRLVLEEAGITGSSL